MPNSQITDATVTHWLETHNGGISPMVTRGYEEARWIWERVNSNPRLLRSHNDSSLFCKQSARQYGPAVLVSAPKETRKRRDRQIVSPTQKRRWSDRPQRHSCQLFRPSPSVSTMSKEPSVGRPNC